MNQNQRTLLFSSTILAAMLAAAPAQRPSAQSTGEYTPDAFKIEKELGRRPALSQGSTGTCWCFSTTSFLESELERLHGRPFDLSEIHTVYYTYLEKARRYVRLHGKAQFAQGELCHDVLHIIRNYGAVPADAYTGLREGDTRHNHGEMETVLAAMLEKIATGRKPSDKWEDAVRGVLDAYIGPVPDSIQAEGRAMLPQEYEARVLKLPFDDYRQIMSFRSRPYGQKAELLVPDNWMRHQDYWNVPLDEMMDNLDNAVRSGYSVAIDIDVSESTRLRREAVYVLSPELEKEGAVTEELRQQQFDDRMTTDDHLMHVVGIARHKDGRIFYLTKDSGGPSGPFAGHKMISRNYVMLKVLSFMVHRDGLLSDTTDGF